MATILRKCRFIAAGGGLDDFVVGASVPGFVLPVTAKAEETTYNYIAFFGDEWESGDGFYSIANPILTRDVCLSSSNNDDFVNFSSPPTVIMTYAIDIPASGRLIKSTLFTSSATWNKDLKTKNILAIGTGGGAGGISGGNNPDTGIGGGSGATSISFLDVSLISSLGVTIGSGGTGGPAAGGNGASGGDTILGSNILVAKGAVAQNGGLSSSGVGQIKADGNVGLDFPNMTGAPSWWGGGGGKFGNPSIAPTAGLNYGAGGGGTVGNGVALSGRVAGAGSPGAMWILEFT